MRRAIILGALVSLMAVFTPAQAAPVPPGTSCATTAGCKITHAAPLPCHFVCAYWLNNADATMNACETPFPEGSYDYTKFRIDSETGIVRVTATSPIDYDSFICADLGRQGWVQVGQMANNLGEECDGIGGRSLAAVGCTENGTVSKAALTSASGFPNDKFVVISYNWSDNGTLPMTVKGPATVLEDTFTAGCPSGLC